MELNRLLERMKMDSLAVQLDAFCEQAAKKDLGYREFLTAALQTEWNGRHQKGVEARMKLARFPWVKTLEGFDFAFQPSLDRKVIRELTALGFVDRCENIIILGPPGVGKTHLAIALGIKALDAGHTVLFLSLESLMTRLTRARRENRVERQLQQFVYPKVLIIDEMGYLPLDELGATVFFQLVSARYERGAIVLTSNKSYADWGMVFGDTIIATAILDRLLHHSTTVNIRGESYRLKDRKRAGLLSSPHKQDNQP